MHIDEFVRANHCHSQQPISLFWYDLIYLIDAGGIPSSRTLNDYDSYDGDDSGDGRKVEGFVGGKCADYGDDNEYADGGA